MSSKLLVGWVTAVLPLSTIIDLFDKADGRKNWLLAGSLRSGKRTAAIMSLIQSARLNGHDPYAYLKDVLARLPTQRANEITDLIPHRWMPV